MQATGRSLTRNLTLPIVGLGVVATKFALDYRSAFAQIDASTNASQEQIEEWRRGVLSLSGRTAQAPVELAQGLYILASAGLRNREIFPTLAASAKAAAAGYGEAADIAKIAGAVLNAYADEGLHAADVTDILAAAVREGRAAPDEFSGAIGRIIPIASKAQVSFAQVAASLASVSNIGLDVNEGVTAMRGLLRSLTAPTEETIDTLKKLGLTAGGVRKTLAEDGLLAALDLLDEKSNGEIQTLQHLIPNVRALTGFFALQDQEVRKVDGAFDRVIHSKGDLDEAFGVIKKDPLFQFNKALNELRVQAIKLGNEIIPVLTDTVVPAIHDVARAFNDLSPAMKDFIIKGAAVAALAGPFIYLAGSLLKIVSVGARVATVLTGIGTAAAGSTGKVAGLGGALAKIGSGSALAGTAIAGLTAIGTAGLAGAAISLNDLIKFDPKEAANEFVPQFQTETIRAVVAENTGFWDAFMNPTKPIGAYTDDVVAAITEEANRAIQKGADPEKVAGILQANFAAIERSIGGVNEGTEGVRQATRDILGLGGAAGLSATTLLEAGDVADRWTRILINSGDAETNAGRKLAQLLTGIEHTSDGLNDLTANQVENLLAVGDTAGALALLQKAYDRAMNRQNDWTEGTAKEREETNKAAIAQKAHTGAMNNASDAAKNAALKGKKYSDYIKGLPPNLRRVVEAQRAASASGNEAAESARNAGKAMGDSGKQAQEAGGKVVEYGGKLDNLPPEVRTKVTAETGQANAAIAALQRKLAILQQQTYTVFLNVVQGGSAPKPPSGPPSVPGHKDEASGTDDFPGGMAYVGERGPELVFLPQHSKVVPHNELRTVGGPEGRGSRMVILEGVVDVDTGRIRAIAREEVDDDHRYQAALGRMR
jgi:TP901 family phage tail tape measure protein